MVLLAIDARWNGLWADPRFKALLARLNLPEIPARSRF